MLMDKAIQYTIEDFYKDFKNPDQIYKIFEIYSIRAQVGCRGAIIFEIRTKEKGHNIPHLHAKYENKEISISLIDFTVLDGKLPAKQAKIAVDWTKENILALKEKWNEYHIYTIPVF